GDELVMGVSMHLEFRQSLFYFGRLAAVLVVVVLSGCADDVVEASMSESSGTTAPPVLVDQVPPASVPAAASTPRPAAPVSESPSEGELDSQSDAASDATPVSPGPMNDTDMEPPRADDANADEEPEALDEEPEVPEVLDEEPEAMDRFVPGQAVLPRLTAQQYRNTVNRLFDQPMPFVELEPDTNPYLFYSIGATTTEVSEYGIELYGDAAQLLVRQIFSDASRRDALYGCEITSVQDRCFVDFLLNFGRRIYRRPLSADEYARWSNLVSESAQDGIHQAIEFMVRTMLESVHFLYRVELGEPDPTQNGIHRYTNYEMATRLSYFLTNSMPDEALFAAAERGELLTDDGIKAQANRLLAQADAQEAVQDFFGQYLDLGRLKAIELDPERYPGFSPQLLDAMAWEVRLLVDDLVFRQDGDIKKLFYDRRGYVNSDLAALYGVDAPEAQPHVFVPVEFGADSARAGDLSLGAFLTMNAHPSETSPTLRGKYFRERIFCETVPPPPDDVNTNLPEVEEGEVRTLRERLEQHRSDPACAGCHAYIDPPGFLFEHFDSMGRYREQVDGLPIDASGNIDGTELNSVQDLALFLKEEQRVGKCIVRQVYRHATGRLEEIGEYVELDRLYERFERSGHNFRDLLLDVVTSPGFRTISTGGAP
ncbi:MAG: DUF1592 domain-containing protein, partial [Myxococcota bacterium]|nr:DUF1592 domain-containing protein [Myxococcota bacterium]